MLLTVQGVSASVKKEPLQAKIMGWTRVELGFILGSFWVDRGFILGSFWVHFGFILGCSRVDLGFILGCVHKRADTHLFLVDALQIYE